LRTLTTDWGRFSVNALRVAEDRSLEVPMGRSVRSGYVHRDVIRLACLDRMAVGDVEHAMRRRMACAPGQPWPCPVGQWDGDRFTLLDGRHEYVAGLMLGVEHFLVAWIE